MGYGSYKASDWAKLKNSRGLSAGSSAQDIFKDNELKDQYNPRFINMRESCDSEDSPNSTPVILAFDVTGSMGYLAEEIAKNSLNKTVTELYDKQPITNPHIMCAAITEPTRQGGLQVTQFEADIRVVEQLLDLKVMFGGNRFSYDSLIWYFAAKHTSIDSWTKRKKKGFLFCIGDEVCGAEYDERLTAGEIREVFGDSASKDLPLAEVYRMAAERYEIFHIVTGHRAKSSTATWTAFLPGRTAMVTSENLRYLSEVITSIMQTVNGMDREAILSQWSGGAKTAVEEALETIAPDDSGPRNVKIGTETGYVRNIHVAQAPKAAQAQKAPKAASNASSGASGSASAGTAKDGDPSLLKELVTHIRDFFK